MTQLKADREFKLGSEFEGKFSRDCVDFVKQAMAFDISQRASVSQLLDHEWMNLVNN